MSLRQRQPHNGHTTVWEAAKQQAWQQHVLRGQVMAGARRGRARRTRRQRNCLSDRTAQHGSPCPWKAGYDKASIWQRVLSRQILAANRRWTAARARRRRCRCSQSGTAPRVFVEGDAGRGTVSALVMGLLNNPLRFQLQPEEGRAKTGGRLCHCPQRHSVTDGAAQCPTPAARQAGMRGRTGCATCCRFPQCYPLNRLLSGSSPTLPTGTPSITCGPDLLTASAPCSVQLHPIHTIPHLLCPPGLPTRPLLLPWMA